MQLSIEVEQEDDGLWLTEVPDLPGVMAYGHTRQEAIERVQALALRIVAERSNTVNLPICDFPCPVLPRLNGLIRNISGRAKPA